MLETAIVGGGLCGVALARGLQRQGGRFALFEARPRLGGRILSVACARSGMAIDLGPSWFWPELQPLVARLVAELGLTDFPQHDEGVLLHLREPDKTPEPIDRKGVHGGARRLQQGMASLIDALAKDLPPSSVLLGHVLTSLQDRRDHVVLAFRVGEDAVEISARRAVLALSPRLMDEHVRFEPDLDDATRQAMRGTETWMAAEAKVVISYDQPYWRQAGQSGNAFVTHELAVIGEIFDACDMTSTNAALAGFLALTPEPRQTFDAGLSMLMVSQMAQVFGPALEHSEPQYQDWAIEPYTCSTLDRRSLCTGQSDVANPLLRRALWDGKLHLGGSETAARGAGYLEGALEAARRIEHALSGPPGSATLQEASCLRSGRPDGDAGSANAVSLARFYAWVGVQGDPAFDGYRHRLNHGLASRQTEQLTRRAVLGSIEEVFGKALEVLEALAFDTSAVTVEHGRSALTPHIQRPFDDFIESLLDDVRAFNRTSCVLSNFSTERHLSDDYVQTILRDIAAAWREFSRSANRVLLAKAGMAERRHPAARREGSMAS